MVCLGDGWLFSRDHSLVSAKEVIWDIKCTPDVSPQIPHSIVMDFNFDYPTPHLTPLT